MDDQAKVIAILEGGLYNEATLLQLMHWVDETTRTFGLSKSATQEEKKELKTVARNIIGKYTIQGILDRAFGEAPGKTHFKTRNETGSDLSLGTRLTVLSKRLRRKRCCHATPDRCLECNRLTILTAHC